MSESVQSNPATTLVAPRCEAGHGMTSASQRCAVAAQPVPGSSVRETSAHYRVEPIHEPRRGKIRAVSVHTDAGLVRDENQDAVGFVAHGAYQAVLIADGVGGTPLGGLAARATIKAGKYRIERLLEDANEQHWTLEQLSVESLQFASRYLGLIAKKRGIRSLRQGLRTTFIVAVATANEVGYAYVGDGGLLIVREDGAVEELLEPMRLNGSNVITSSLGPHLQGTVGSGTAAISDADIVIAGSDGIFDFVGDLQEFAREVKKFVTETDDFSGASEKIVTGLASYRTEDGMPVISDNLSIGLIGRAMPER